jgi:hypothetical protein
MQKKNDPGSINCIRNWRLATVPMPAMVVLHLCEGFKQSGCTRSKKEPAVSIALDEYLLKTCPDVQKVALDFENDHIRDHPSQDIFVSQMCYWW